MDISKAIRIGALMAYELPDYVMDEYLNVKTFLFLRESEFKESDADFNGWPNSVHPVLVPDELILAVGDLCPNKIFSHAATLDNVFSVRNVAIACDYAWKWRDNG